MIIMDHIIKSTPFVFWGLTLIVFNITRNKIPNLLVIVGGLLAAFQVILNCSPFAISEFDALCGLVAASIAFIPLFATGLIGGADLKVFAVLGAWCGVHGIAIVWLAATCAIVILMIAANISKEQSLKMRAHPVSLARPGDPTSRILVPKNQRNSIRYTDLLVVASLTSLLIKNLQ